MKELTNDQQKDIALRVKEAHDYLKANDLQVACQIVKENLGNDVFGDRLYPYLQDTKFSTEKGVKSPLQDEFIKPN